MDVLLTGGSGFVGCHVARLLLEQGHEVWALVRQPGVLSGLRELHGLSRLHILVADLTQPEEVKACLHRAKPEICVHLAWPVEKGGGQNGEGNITALQSGLSLATALRDSGCRRLIVSGSCFEYDVSHGLLREGLTPTRPHTLYGASKLALWGVLEQWNRLGVFLTTDWLRIFYLYGPWEDRRRLVPSVITSLLRGEPAETTGGHQVRDYIHVEDAARAILTCVEREGPGGMFNVGSGNPVQIKKVVERLAEIIERPELLRVGALPYRADDPAFICADGELSRRVLGWTPQYDLESGLQNTVAWWRQNL